MNMQQSQAVSSLSLESYLQLHKALTKQGHAVQSVTPIEECYYKIGDLRQLLQLHGLTAAKFNRAELLAAIKGQTLINPCSSNSSSENNSSGTANAAAAADQSPGDLLCDDGADADLPSVAADCCAVMGIQQRSSPQLLKFLRLGSAPPHLPATAAASALAAGAIELHTADAAAAACSADATPSEALPGITPSVPASTAAAPGSADMMQLQRTVMTHQYRPQQAAVAAGTQLQPQHGATTTQQLPEHFQPGAGVASVTTGAAIQTSMAADPLHRLLATLLTQHTMGPASAGMTAMQPALQQQQQHFSQPMLQSGFNAGQTPVDSLIQQLLLGPAAHSSSLLQANMAAHAAAMPVAAATAAAASIARVSNSATETLPSLNGAPSAAAAACASGAEAGQPHRSAQAAVALQLADLPQQSHTPWLKAQLQWLADNGLRVAQETAAAAAAAAIGSPEDGGLLGRRVGFMLLDEMQVLGPRTALLTLPPGFYEGLAVKYLGSSCQADVCELGCTGQHQFYRARILQPRAVPDPTNSSSSSADAASLAASLSQAEAATSGRPVLLILDLHPRLRAGSLQELLQVETAEPLQDAWVLVEVESEGPGSQPGAGTCEAAVSAAAAAAAAAAATNKRGRKPGTVGRPGQVKKARL